MKHDDNNNDDNNSRIKNSSSNRVLLRGSLLLLLLLFWLLVSVADAQQCTVCIDGTPVSKPHHPIELEFLPVNTCAELDLTVNFLIAGSDICFLVNAIGPVCGCDVAPGRCDLCGQTPNALLTNPRTVLDGLSGLDVLPDFPLSSQLVSISCEILHAILLSQYQENTDMCTEWQDRYSTECGCLAPTGTPSSTTLTPTLTPIPSQTPTTNAPSRKPNYSRVGPRSDASKLGRYINMSD